METIKRFFLLAFVAVTLNACLGDPPVYRYDNIVIVINQGNFTDQNGSISYYYEDTKEVKENVLNIANGTTLGASIQSAEVSNTGALYLVCNYADKIEVFDISTGRAVASPFTGSDLSSPRYIAGGNSLYITNWGEGVDNGSGWQIFPDSYVLALSYYNNNWVAGRKIPCGTSAEDIRNINNKLYVATEEGIAVIDVNNGDAIDLIIPPAGTFGGAKSFVQSKNNLLWASYPDAQKLVAIDLTNNSVQGAYDMPLDWMGPIACNYAGTKIYSCKDNSIFELDVDTKAFETFFTGVSGAYFYSIGVSPFTGNVYTANTKFDGNSTLLVLSAEGNLIDQKTVGVGTCGFRFLQKVEEQ
ncbi:MAG: hypothetical protein FWH23_01970 [Bacteroidales bacterium]|nr:hypothetical protein [Bacteroidales bacterium]